MVLYILQSESGKVLDKDLGWVKLCDAQAIFSSEHKDVALNQLIELNAHDIRLRARVVSCESDHKGRPDLNTLAA